MYSITYKTVKNAINILVNRDEVYKINGVILIFGPRSKFGPYSLKDFEAKAVEYILKKHPMVLSPLEIELL